jgi:glyoxalase superfamily protein
MSRFQITIDCADPAILVEFWSTVLAYIVQPPPDGHADWNSFWRSIGVPENELDPDRDNADSIIDPEGHGPRIWFQVVPEVKQIKNRIHLDRMVADRSRPLIERRALVDAEVERVVAAGATVVRVLSEDGVDHYGVTLQDPEGNEFCVA